MVTIERGGSPRPIDKFITNDENGLNWVKIGDAPEHGNYITQTTEKIRPEGLSKTREVHPGDLILSNSMSFGRPYIMAIDGCIHDGWLAIRDTKKNFELKFLCTLLGTDGMLNQYKAMAAGSTVNNLNKELVGGTTVAFPMMEEQIKIGDYFTTIDHLITLHQRKCEETKILKKYMLQKMFPQNGQKVPEIRFKGFTEDWEQRKWMNSVDISTEMVDPASGEYDDMPHIAPGNIESFTGRILDNVRTVKEEQLISGKFRFRPDDVVYGKINPQLGKYFYASIDGLTSADAYVFKGKNGITQKFLFSVLQTSDFFKYSVSVSKRSGMPKINRDELNAYAFLAPSEEEQDKIGNFLLKIDHLITLHQRKCEELKNIKKFMLQNMFV